MAYSLTHFFHSLARRPKQLTFTVLVATSFLTIPVPIRYDLPPFEPKPPLYQELAMVLPSPQPYPVNITQTPVPYLSAQSAIVVDVDSKAVIYSQAPDTRLPPASTTKMITAMVALDLYGMEKVASISSPLREGQVMKLLSGEHIRTEALLKGALIHSANDAAYQLAQMHPDGYEAFIAQMNTLVGSYKLTDTHFQNPMGFDHWDHYSTVHDLAIIGAHFMSNPVLAEIVNTPYEVVRNQSGNLVHELENVNELLGVVPGMKGIKTGWTEVAGECLVAYVERDGQRIITALLGSYDRFGETTTLVEWVFANHTWQEIPPIGGE